MSGHPLTWVGLHWPSNLAACITASTRADLGDWTDWMDADLDGWTGWRLP